MVFRKYSPELKYSAVRAAIDGKNLTDINEELAATISQDSLSRWLNLYERTRAVVCDPDTYLKRGRTLHLTDDDVAFIKELVTDNPTLYVDEIKYSLAEQHGVLVSISTILNTLHERLKMSKKSISTVNPRQDQDERADYIAQISCLPTKCLVFTGEQAY